MLAFDLIEKLRTGYWFELHNIHFFEAPHCHCDA